MPTTTKTQPTTDQPTEEPTYEQLKAQLEELKTKVKAAKPQATKGPSPQEIREGIANRMVTAMANQEWSPEEAAKVSNWLQHLPVPKAEWPTSLPLPTTKKWREDNGDTPAETPK